MAAKVLANFTRQFAGGTRIDIRGFRMDGAQSPITVLFGASGAGKTTVLRCLAGLEQPDTGEITCNDAPWFSGEQRINLPPQRRHVGYLSQDFALFPHLSAAANVAYGLRALEASEREVRVSEIIELFELKGLERRFPHQLSGGQQQRLALARAVVRRPQLLLLDEPLSALDHPTRVRLRGELRRWLLKLQIPGLVVTHDRIEAMALGDYLLVLHDGQIAQAGTPAEVFNRPANFDVASILAIETIQTGRIVSADAGLLTVEAGRTKLVAVDETGQKLSAAVHVCIRAEDVIVVKGTSGPSSARNHLPSVIQTITPEGPLMRVELDCGFPLTAVLTRQACETLALTVGDSVVALIKAPHVHLLPRSE